MVGAQSMRVLVVLMLAAALAGCAAAEAPEVAPTVAPSAPESGPQPLIGLDGQAFIDTLEAEGFACSEPQPFTTALQQWNCAAQVTEVEGISHEVIILGESLTAIHSIDASIDQFQAIEPDDSRAAGFLASIAESAGFTGADTAAAEAWVLENATVESIQLELPGVTYNLRGPQELRALEIVATD